MLSSQGDLIAMEREREGEREREKRERERRERERARERESIYIYVYACMQSDTSILREGFVNQLVTGVVSGNPLDALAICV